MGRSTTPTPVKIAVNRAMDTSLPPLFIRPGLLGLMQVAQGAPLELDEDAPTFADALKEQLGIKMLPQKGPSELFLVDHIEKPSEN
jgi:uncharacterized protein (TIGR03435 family)